MKELVMTANRNEANARVHILLWRKWLRVLLPPISLSPLLLVSLAPLLLAFLSVLAADEQVDYLEQIKPILRERCFACHGALKQEVGLRLDTAALAITGGDSGAVIQPGDAAASVLLKRVTATNVDERMPPLDEGEPLTVAQVALLRRWIEAGVKGPADEQREADPNKHWAFQPIIRPDVPQMEVGWVRNPIDAFLQQRHQQHGIKPQPEAPRIVLLRRLHLDLIGIPPTLEEIAACEADSSPQWYEQTAKRLLDDPRHGERWARHWMDIWRYSDWWGLGDQLRNSQKHIWHWRDWIVESLNDDTPYDEMVRLMLAADELHPSDLNKLRATGYLARNYNLFNRPQWMEETVEHVSKGLLGLTMNCSRCHDHKYDPLEQTDYYRIRACFEPLHVRLDVLPGEADLSQDGIPRVFDGLLEEPTYRYIRGDERNPDKSIAIAAGVPAILAFDELKIEPMSLPVEAWQPERRPWVLDAYISAAQKRVTAAESELKNSREKVLAAIESEAKAKKEKEEAAKQAAVDILERTPIVADSFKNLDARAEQSIAEAALIIAQAELESVERRAEAQRAEWNPQDQQLQNKTNAAVRAERLVTVAKSRHSVTVAEQTLQRAAAEKKEAAEKTLREAREALEKAVKATETEVAPTDQYAKFKGAMWTPTRFLNSGNDDPEVKFQSQSSGRRTALANWITDRRNPLTARVAVNHIWTRHIGQPLVPTMFDFGRKGTPSTHPELLDWLASELIASGWSMKHVHSLILNSAAYRMSSSARVQNSEEHNSEGEKGRKGDGEKNATVNPSSPALPLSPSPSLLLFPSTCLQSDPENHLWWRRVPIRLESQLVRDSLLALAGTLDPTRGGPSVPSGQQETSTRRSLYFFHSNNERNLFLTTFDEALVRDCYRREQSIVPQQALALSNSPLALDAAEKIALRLSEHQLDDAAFIRAAFRFVTGINPNQDEIATSAAALEAWKKFPGGNDKSARANLVWTLINHNDFVTLR